MSRTFSAIGLALAVATGLAFLPSAAQAQKGLVYCPVSIDATGCGPIVAALTTDPSPFPDGVQTAYDGSSGTVDLATADLSAYAVLVVPSLADGAGAEPYGLLRDQQIVGRLSPAFNGRNAVWSGTPDHGSTNRAAKDALLRNLAGWAKSDAAAGRGPGIVVLQDNSDDAASRYGWLRGISGLSVVADTTFDVYSNVQVLTTTGQTILTSSGLQIGYTNMAAYGLIASGTGVSNDATGGRTTRVVLVTAAGQPSDPNIATVSTDKEDYQPGDTITVTGAGWAPGETVSLLFQEDVNPPIHPDITLTTVADAAGHIFNRQFEIDSADIGVRFTLTATGQTSGRTAQATFTDDRAITAATVAGGASVTVVVGQSITGGVTVNTTTNGGGGPAWLTTSWRYATTSPGGSFSIPCADTPDHITVGTFTETFSTTAPGSPGIYNAYFLAWRTTSCGSNPSNLFTLTNAVTVNKGNSTTSVATSGSPAVFGSVILTATVAAAAPASGNPSGTVTFKDGAATLGTGTLSCAAICTATFAASTLTIGGSPHSITAVYAGDASFNGSTSAPISQTITKANTTTTVSSPSNPTVFGQSFTFNATVAAQAPGSGTPSGTVQFRVDGSDLGSPVTLSGATATSPPVSGLSVGAHTLAAVYGGDGNFNGSTSADFTHTVGKANQTITFSLATLPAKTFGDPPFSVASFAIASSGLTVTFSSTTPSRCTSSGTDGATITLLTALGQCTIRASQAGNATFNAAPDVDQSFNVAKANQTIAFTSTAPVGAIVGGATYTAAATATSGLTVTFSSLTTGVCTSTGTTGATITFVGGGTCTVAANQTGNGDYNAAPQVTQSFSVSAQAAQTITFTSTAPSNAIFGGTYAVTATASSGLTVVFSSLTSPVCTVLGSTVSFVGVGTCNVAANQPGNASFLAAPQVTQSFAVGQASQTITFAGLANKTYSDADFTVGATASSGLAVSFAASGNCTVLGTTVHLTGNGSCTITASQAGNANYTAAADVPQTFSIDKASVTPHITVAPKEYDGTRTATITNRSLSGVVGLDDVSLDGGTATFDDKNAGTGKTVTGTGFTLIGADATKYQLSSATATTTANITRRAITVAASADSREYDGTRNSSKAPTITVGTLASGDVAEFTQTYDTKKVGTGKTLTPTGTVTDGNSGNNYNISFADNTTGVITKRPLTVSATGVDKTYDGTTDATVNLSDDRVTDDVLTTSYTSAHFDTRNAGSNKTVTVTGIDVTGTDAENYTFNNSTTTTAKIDPRPITVTAVTDSRDYDGTTNSAATPVITLGTLVTGDLAVFTQRFDNKNAGTGKTLIPAGAVTDGNSGLNYDVTFVNNTTGVIKPRPIAVAADAKSKIYGDDDPALTYHVTSGSLVVGDEFAGGLTRAAGENVIAPGPTYAIGQGSLTAGSNYTLSFTGADLTILQATLTVTADNNSKYYGDLVPSLTGNIVGIKFTDNISATYTAYVLGGGLMAVTTTTPASTTPYPIIPLVTSAPAERLGNYKVQLVNGGLTIQKAPASFNSLVIPNVVFGQGSSTVSGNLKYVTNVPGAVFPTGSVSIMVNGQTQTGTIQSNGNFTATFNTSSFPVGGTSGLPVALSYNGSDPNFTSAGGSGAMIVQYNRAVGTRFLQPVNLYPDPRSSFKITSTIPVKFQIFLADGITPYGGANATIQLIMISSLANDQVNEEIITTPADDGTTFRYDGTGKQYIYNMGTKTLAQGVYTINADLHDGGPPVTAAIELRSK